MANWWEAQGAAWNAGEAEASQAWGAKATGQTWETPAPTDAKDNWTAAGAQWDAAAPAPAVDAWDQGGKWGQGADPNAGAAGATDGQWVEPAQAWQAPPAGKEFWEHQAWNLQGNVLSRKDESELLWDDQHLFDQSTRAQAGAQFGKYATVQVEKSGIKSDNIPMCDTFRQLFDMFKDHLPKDLEMNLEKCGYQQPTPVQRTAIPVGLVGRDVMCCAQTGSGKTLAFLVPVIGRMMLLFDNPVGAMNTPFQGPCSPWALVMTPTRELCIQIYEEALKYCHRTSYVVQRVYGGEGRKEQYPRIAKGADILIATPGRLKDFLDQGVVKVSNVHTLVLDEADRMLDMGFEAAVREIVNDYDMPKSEAPRATMMFSATFPEKCQMLAQDFLFEYIWIAVGTLGGAVDTVEQVLEQVEPGDKFKKLVEILDDFHLNQDASQHRMLIFTNAKDTAKWLDEQLYEKKFETGALHGNLTQAEREANLLRFRTGDIHILIATDVAARGLDIQNVAIVVNYDFPKEIDSYVHRIGRSGRIGNSGKAISFVAMGPDGSCLEHASVIDELVQCMTKSASQIPDWLQRSVANSQAGNSGGWHWGGRDARPGMEETTQEVQQSWNNWEKASW